MKALSILQPYAWLITTGSKDIENRTWWTGYRGPVLIHAGKTYPKWEYKQDAEGDDTYPSRESMIGGIVGIATITDCVKESENPWFNGPWGFVLTDRRACPLVPMLGERGFFDVPNEILLRLPSDWRLMCSTPT